MVTANMDEPETRPAKSASSSPTLPATASGALRVLSPAEQATFVDFYRDSLPRLVAFLRWQGVPLVAAVDVAQETMVQAYRLWATIDHPPAWARRVASRIWARQIACNAEDPVADIPERTSLFGDPDIVAWEQRHDVLQILDRLPARQRQVLAWTLDGYSRMEIAAELRMTAEAVRSSLAKARRALAASLPSDREAW